ncbi:MAG: general secretion pathway protein GspF [Gammaproteobacteria bacterium]|nr:general secretion pathway protein GspF [Gammaproteobacteria bacterium]
MGKKRKSLHPNEPLRHNDHPRPVSRRDFLRQGFITGSGVVMGGGIFSLFSNPHEAYAAVSNISGDIHKMADIAGCPVGGGAGTKLPFICFDLAGGASLAGANVLAGGPGGQKDFISTAGYSKFGIPDTMLPTAADENINSELGLLFHEQSTMKNGIVEKAGSALNRINGVLIPARSDNDTGNNPHNPMFAIARAFLNDDQSGKVLSLVGSRNSDSGGNSTFPPSFMNPELIPTKIDRPSDITGMLDTGSLTGILDKDDLKVVMESVARLSHQKLSKVSTGTIVSRDELIENLVKCGYLSAADIADRFADVKVNPAEDEAIVGDTGIFSQGEWDGPDRNEFRKTASVMKMVLDGYAGAGTITMGGYDYHTGERVTGDDRDERAGRCIGACLNYAARRGVPLMIYVCSDGSVSSNGRPDPNADGKGEWTTDNSSTAASFILLFDPLAGGRPQILTNTVPNPSLGQIGWFSRDASVVRNSSPAADNVLSLVNTVLLNYMSASGMISSSNTSAFTQIFTDLSISHGLGNNFDRLMAFGPVNSP